MESKLNGRSFIWTTALFLGLTGAGTARAYYVEVELDNGQHVIGSAYASRDTSLLVFTPAGTVEVDRKQVRRVDEHDGNLPASALAATGGQGAPSPSTGSFRLPNRGTTEDALKEEDPRVRQDKIARQLIFLYRDRALAVNNRDQDAVKAIDAKIEEMKDARGDKKSDDKDSSGSRASN